MVTRREFLVVGISTALALLMGCENKNTRTIRQKIENKNNLSSLFYKIRGKCSIKYSNDIMKHYIELIQEYSDYARIIKNIDIIENNYPYITIKIELDNNNKTSKEILKYYALMMLTNNPKNTEYYKYLKNNTNLKIELTLLGLRYPKTIDLNKLINKKGKVEANEWEILLYILLSLKNIVTSTIYLMSINDEPFIVIIDEDLKNYSVSEIQELVKQNKVTIFPTIETIFSNKDFNEASKESLNKFREMLNKYPLHFCEVWSIDTKTEFIVMVHSPEYGKDLKYYNTGPDIGEIEKYEVSCFEQGYIKDIPDDILNALKEHDISISKQEIEECKDSFTKFIRVVFSIYNNNRVNCSWHIFSKLFEQYINTQPKPVKVSH